MIRSTTFSKFSTSATKKIGNPRRPTGLRGFFVPLVSLPLFSEGDIRSGAHNRAVGMTTVSDA